MGEIKNGIGYRTRSHTSYVKIILGFLHDCASNVPSLIEFQVHPSAFICVTLVVTQSCVVFFNGGVTFHVRGLIGTDCSIFTHLMKQKWVLIQMRGWLKPVHRRCFIFLFVLLGNIGVRDSEGTPSPLCWRSINPPRFIFYHALSTDFEDKIEGLWTG